MHPEQFRPGLIRKFTLAIGFLSFTTAAWAGPMSYAVISDRMSYDGEVTVYNSLSDAVSGTSARSGPHDIPSFDDGGATYEGRDLGLAVSRGAPTSVIPQDYNYILTAWYYTTTDGPSGSGNPNNTNTGLIQIGDIDSSTRTSSHAGWDANRDRFTMSVSGSNTSVFRDLSRLWPAPIIGGSSLLSAGSFVDYSFQLTADFANSATEDPSNPGWYFLNEEPIAVSGTLKGIFDNRCTDLSALSDGAYSCPDTSVDGFYAFDFDIGLQSWAFDNLENLGDAHPYSTSYFAAEVPEPSSLPLMMFGFSAIAVIARRRIIQ